MIILGIQNVPDSFVAIEEGTNLNKKILDLLEAHPRKPLFLISIPAVDKVWVCGVLGKLDTMTFFTTEAEMQTQRDKYSPYFGPRSVYNFHLSI